MQVSLFRGRTGQWDQQPIVTQRFDPPILVWRKALLFIVFGLLFVLVVAGCTASPSPFVAIALVAALAIAVLSVLRPRFALLLVFTGAGLPSLLLPLPSHTMRLIEPALLLCLLAVVVRRSHLRLRLSHLLALLFVAIAIISFIHVPDVSTDLNAYAADKRLYELILVFIAFFSGTFLVKYVKEASSFLVAVLLSNIPLYFIGLAQAVGIQLSPLLEASNAQDPTQSAGRLWGPYSGAATFGLYLINLFAVALACWLLGTRRRDRIIGAIMTIATALEIVGSGTRNAVVAMAILVVVSLVLTRRFKSLLGAMMLAGMVVTIFSNRILSLFAHPETSIDNRIFLWQEAIKLIAANPWIGIGLQQFYVYYAQLVVSQAAQLNARGISVHNQYLEWAMESGIIWLIVGVLLLLSIASSCWKAYRIARPGQQVLLLATMLALLANIVCGFFDVPLDKPEAAVYLFLLAGLSLGYAERIRWDGPTISAAVPTSPSPVTRVMGPTDVGGVYQPLPRQPQEGPPPPQQLSQSGTAAASAADSAPNMQKTGRTVFIQLLSWGIAIPIIFPTTALLTRYLGPVQYGEYSFTLPFLSVFALLGGIGMDALIIRQLSRQPRAEWSDTLSYAAGTRLLFTVLGGGAAALLSLVVPVSSEQRNLLLLGSVSLVFSFSLNGLRMIYSHGFRAEQRVSVLSLIEITNRVVTAGLVALVFVFRLSLLWAYILIVYSDLPFFFLLMLIARRRYGIRLRFSLARVREHLFSSLPLMGYNVLVLIGGQADVFLLMALTGPLNVGIYALAMRITDPLLSIVVAYVTGLYPLLCTKFEEGREQFALVYHQAVRILALGIIPLAIFVSMEANSIVTLLGGQHFAAAAIAVQLLMWAMAATFFSQLAVRACMAANKERLILYVTVVSVGVNVLANLALIPHWQIVGAGVTALVSELVGLCLFSVLLIRHVSLLSIIGVVLRVFLGNLPALAFLLWQQHAPLLLAAPVTLALTIVGCVATRTLLLNDIRMARRMLFNRTDKELSRDNRSTTILPAVGDISDWPTTILPRVTI